MKMSFEKVCTHFKDDFDAHTHIRHCAVFNSLREMVTLMVSRRSAWLFLAV